MFVLATLKEFPFSSSSQRMGVIIKTSSHDHFQYYCKGSPEIILDLVKKETVPLDYHSVLKKYADDGYRVIGLAHKDLDFDYKKVGCFLIIVYLFICVYILGCNCKTGRCWKWFDIFGIVNFWK